MKDESYERQKKNTIIRKTIKTWIIRKTRKHDSSKKQKTKNTIQTKEYKTC